MPAFIVVCISGRESVEGSDSRRMSGSRESFDISAGDCYLVESVCCCGESLYGGCCGCCDGSGKVRGELLLIPQVELSLRPRFSASIPVTCMIAVDWMIK